MLLSMLVSLYTSRVVLNVLGETDFGVYNVVAGVVIMLGFFQSSLSNAAQRYISIAIGKNDIVSAKEAFKQSRTILLLFSILVMLLGESIGLWFVGNSLNIPVGRKCAVCWIYQFSLLSTFVTLNEVSMIALVISREKMSFYAFLGLFDVTFKLVIVYFLVFVNSDKLVVYGLLVLLVTLLTYCIYYFYCKNHFNEFSNRLYWNHKLAKEMFKFVGYNMFGCFSYACSDQGVSIILNIYFGPSINAAKGISSQVMNSVIRFTDSILTAFRPQLVKSYAANDLDYMRILLEKSSKLAFFFTALLICPFIMNINYVLSKWLGIVPEYAEPFTIIILIHALLTTLSSPLWYVANGTGNIKNNQVYGRLITLLTLPLSIITLFYYKDPILVMCWVLVTQIGYWLYSLYDINNQLDLDLKSYIRNVIKPCFSLFIILFGVSYSYMKICKKDSFFFFFCSSFCTILLGLGLIYLLLNNSEKKVVKYICIKQLKFIHPLLSKFYIKQSNK